MATPTVSENEFRMAFPEFSDKNAYPSGYVTFWLNLAQGQVNADAWLSNYAQGVYLWLAHQLAMKGKRGKASQQGQVSGPIASKTVGSVSVSYDTGNASEKDAGWWNTTQYGREFFRLSRMFGAGSIQL